MKTNINNWHIYNYVSATKCAILNLLDLVMGWGGVGWWGVGGGGRLPIKYEAINIPLFMQEGSYACN